MNAGDGGNMDVGEKSEASALLRTVFDLIEEAVVIYDPKAKRILEVNDPMLHMFGGLTREEALRWDLSDLVSHEPPFTPARMEALVLEAMAGSRHRVEWLARRFDGSVFPAEITLHGSPAGRSWCVISVFRDQTGILAAEQERAARSKLQESHTRMLSNLISRRDFFSGELEATLRHVTEVSSEVMGVARVSIWRYSPDLSSITCQDLYEAATSRHSSGTVLESVAFPQYTMVHISGEIIDADDVFADARTSEIPHEYFQEHGISSLIDAPIWIGGRLVGLLSFEHTGVSRHWQPEEKQLVTTLSSFVSLYMETYERRKTEALLRESEEKHRLISENVSDVIWVYNLTRQRFDHISPSVMKLRGFSVEEAMGQSLAESLSQESAAGVSDWIGGDSLKKWSDSGSSPVVAELQQLHKDGSLVWVEVTARPRINAAGELEVFGVTRNIEQRKQAELLQRESEELFEKAFITSPYAITLTRVSDGMLIKVNHTFMAITGYTEEEALASNTVALNLWDDPQDRADVIRVLVGGGRVSGWEYRFRKKNGEIIVGLLSSHVIEHRGVPCVLSSINDITERKRNEEEREKLSLQLAQSQKMESVGRLAGGVAHDFNNMLSIILANTDFALEHLEPGRPPATELGEIRKAAQHSVELTRQLLAFARRQTVSPQVLVLNDTVSGMLKMLRRLIGEDVDLVWQPGPDAGSVKIDPSQLDQILTNLCVNARDAIDDVGRVVISTSRRNVDATAQDDGAFEFHADVNPGDYAVLTVADSGCGMDATTVSRLFEPFFTTKAMGKGTGLGLSTVHGIVQQNQGRIGVRSTPGAGTTMEIWLPSVAAEVPKRHITMEMKAVGGAETILMVEDEEPLLRVVRRMLERLGYTVLAFPGPAEALEAVPTLGAIDLLMTDVVMPGMNGKELAHRLRERFTGIKFLFMSGYTANIIAQHGLLDEGVHFLHKPFTPLELAARVRQALDDHRSVLPL